MPAEPTMPAQATDPPDAAATAALVDGVLDEAARHGRDDLVARLRAASARLDRSDVVVCVVGEFKQGKSALINGLLGADVCPVDDDLATMAVTTVRHGQRATATVHRRDAGSTVVDSIQLEDLASWVTERGNPDNRLGVEQVEVELPHPFLERGITLIDTPGIGGLNAAHAAATLAFLPVADALIFVTDASAELTRSELEFLASAVDAGPLILIALTKIDMYPHWRRILASDERRLRSIDLVVPPYPLSAAVRASAVAHDDPALDRDSGFVPFGEVIIGDVAERARGASVDAALREVRTVLDQLREPLTIERSALERPETTDRLASDLAHVQERLAALADGGAHWSVRLDDEFSGLRSRVEFAFAGQLRQILRDTQDEIERIDPARDWSELSQRVQRQVAGAVRAAFLETTEGAAGIQATISGLLADEEGTWSDDGDPVAFDAASLWQDGGAFGGTLQSGVRAGFGLLAGATVGVDMLGMLGALLGTALVGPVMLGAALFFGGKEVVGERRRQLTERRQHARTFVGQFVEDVTFEVDGRLASLGAKLQREMRTHFAERIGERRRTYEETARAMKRTMSQSETDRDRRLAELRTELEPLDELAARADVLRTSAVRAA